MREICSFPGCKAGSACEKRKNKENGIRNKTMFRFPPETTKPLIRREWEEFLGRKAKNNEVLCELHFQSKDILRTYETLLPNGITHIINRERIILKQNAIPHNDQRSDKSQTDRICDEENTNSNIKEAVAKDVPIPNTPDILRHNEFHRSRKMKWKHQIIQIISHHIYRHVVTSPVTILPKTEIQADLEEPLGSASLTDNVFSLRNLYSQLQEIELPEGWCAVVINNSKSILVAHWPSAHPAHKEFMINDDGTVKVFIKQRSVLIHRVRSIKITDDVMHNITIVKQVLLFSGISVAESDSDLCQGYAHADQRYTRYGCVRCSACKKLSAQISRKEKHEKRKVDKQNFILRKTQKTVKNMKAKNSRMRLKVDSLKKEVEKWKNKSAMLKTEVIEDEILNLPKLQQ